MPVYRDKKRGCLVFEFDRKIAGQRIRVRKILPKAWTQAKADKFDREESARLYAIATGVQRQEWLIEDAVVKYLEEKAAGHKSFENIEKEVMRMAWAYEGRPMSELADVCRLYATKAKRDKEGDDRPLAPATLRNRIRYLTSACRFAWKYHGAGEHDPAERVLIPSVNNARKFTAERRQMIQIARKCACRSSRAAIRIGFYSGMRMGEICRAIQEGGMFKLTDSKNSEPRHIPIHAKLSTAIRVPLRNRWSMSKEFKAAARACGLGDLRFHDLRHSSASAMINAGVDLYTVGAVLGHKSAQSTQRYAHLATASLKLAVDQIGKRGKISPTEEKMRAA